MKKIAVLALAVLLVAALSVPASALENTFGGYWRTRLFHQENFNGEDDLRVPDAEGGTTRADGDTSQVDTRTRLYYTAKFSDNFKFVNRFEFDAVWGSEPLGDIGADGKEFEIKNSFVEFTLDPVPVIWKIGIQGLTLGRGFVFADDASAAAAIYTGETFLVPLIWIKAFEGGTDNNSADTDYYILTPTFYLSETISINPYFVWGRSDDAGEFLTQRTAFSFLGPTTEDANLFYFGLDLNAGFDLGSVWFTGVYLTGELKQRVGDDLDISAYLLAAGGSLDVGPAELHGQFFFASGDDDPADSDLELFFVPQGQSYYWSEIMGFGIFDNTASAGSPADQIGNIWAANLGTSLKPMDKLTATLDLWYARLVEKELNPFNEDKLGFEIDLRLTYQLMENLNLDVVGAYLLAGDATSITGDNQDNPYEVGTQLSLTF